MISPTSNSHQNECEKIFTNIILRKRYVVMNQLSSGKFGTIYKVKDIMTNNDKMVVKISSDLE